GLLLARLGGLDACERAQLLVRQPACERRKRLAELTASQPARDEPLYRFVQLLGEHAPEERPPYRRVRAEPAADEDVVRLMPFALGVARGRSLEAEVADPMLRARVRAAVEVEPQIGDLLAEALLEVLDQLAEPPLRLRDREVAVRLAGAADRRGADVVDVQREADPG